MASIKMCDNCRAMFRAGDTGTSKMSGVVYDQYADGSPHESTFSGDFCAVCTAKVTGRPAPEEDTRLMLTDGKVAKTERLEAWNEGYAEAARAYAYGDEGSHTHDADPTTTGGTA
jgi:hypothetical protein